MLMTFVAALYDVWTLEKKLKTEKNKIKGETNLGFDA